MQQLKISFTFLVFFFCLSAQGQNRKSRPLPQFDNLPYATLSDSILGWSFSLDGQWLSALNTIPARGVSRDDEFYASKENLLGIDNIQKLLVYRVEYGKETYACFVKIFKQGKYKYATRKKGWKEYTSAYYWIVNQKDLLALKDLNSNEVVVERIEAFDGGLIADIKEKDLLIKIKERVVIKPNYDRNLVFTLQITKSPKMMRFQICSLHDIFPDVAGVGKDFTQRGRTVYGATALFDYLYFEVDYYKFIKLIEKPYLEDVINP